MMDAKLRFCHSINGKQYGPGLVRLPRATALALLAQEDATQATEEKLRQEGAALIGVGNRLIPVAANFFEGDISTMPVGMAISGGQR
jgi:hypothetical protein